MKFLYPEFLFALFALAIPLIIHLFNFRRYKRVLFTNVAFLREVNERTQSTRQLKHLLVLLSRMLLLTALVLAFAQPVIPRKDAAAVQAEKAISIFVDNSFSMQSENEDGSLFLQALESARSIAAAYPPSASFQLLTHQFEGRHQRFLAREDFLNQLDEIEIGPQARNLSEIVARQRDLLKTADNKDAQLFVVSDFQQNMCDFDALEPDTLVQMHFVIIPTRASDNVYVDSVWFETPFHNLTQQEKLNIRIRNHSEKQVDDMPLTLWLDGRQAAVGSFNTSPQSYTDTALYFSNDEPGFRFGYVDIDDYPVTFDDRYYFAFNVDSTLKVMEITGELAPDGPDYFSKLFGDDPLYEFVQTGVRMIDYTVMESQHFIILNQLNSISTGLADALERFVDQGGAVFLLPGLSIDAESLNAAMLRFRGPTFENVVQSDARVNYLDAESPFFANLFERIPRNIDLPRVLSYYKMASRTTSNDRTLMRLQTGDAFLSHVPFGSGNLYISAVPLHTENNNFARHATFVTSVLRMSELSRPSGAISYNLGRETAIPAGSRIPADQEVFTVESMDGKLSFIPDYASIEGRGFIFVRDHIEEAGHYMLKLGETVAAGLAFNYPRTESALDYYSGAQLRDQLDARGMQDTAVLDKTGDALEASLLQLESGQKLWKWLILLALLFLLVEILLLKFWK